MIRRKETDITYKYHTKTVNKISANRIQHQTKKLTNDDQAQFILGVKVGSIRKSINVLYHINRSIEKNYIIVTIDAEKVFDDIQYLFFKIKTVKQTETNGFLKNNKTHTHKPFVLKPTYCFIKKY